MSCWKSLTRLAIIDVFLMLTQPTFGTIPERQVHTLRATLLSSRESCPAITHIITKARSVMKPASPQVRLLLFRHRLPHTRRAAFPSASSVGYLLAGTSHLQQVVAQHRMRIRSRKLCHGRTKPIPWLHAQLQYYHVIIYKSTNT